MLFSFSGKFGNSAVKKITSGPAGDNSNNDLRYQFRTVFNTDISSI